MNPYRASYVTSLIVYTLLFLLGFKALKDLPKPKTGLVILGVTFVLALPTFVSYGKRNNNVAEEHMTFTSDKWATVFNWIVATTLVVVFYRRMDAGKMAYFKNMAVSKTAPVLKDVNAQDAIALFVLINFMTTSVAMKRAFMV